MIYTLLLLFLKFLRIFRLWQSTALSIADQCSLPQSLPHVYMPISTLDQLQREVGVKT